MGFVERLQIITTNSCRDIAISHNLQFTAACTKPSQSAVSSPVVAR
jgi:hypothetical protein